MELIFALFNHLTSIAAPSVLAPIILLSIIIFVVFSFKNSPITKFISLFLAGDEKKIKYDDFVALKRRVDISASIADLENTEKRIIDHLDSIQQHVYAQNSSVAEHLNELKILKIEINNEFKNIIEHLKEAEQNLNASNAETQTNFRSLKESIFRNQELLTRLSIQVEKIDEFAKTTVPEFRSYQKDLAKDISELSKDIGIMDRVLQAQINNGKNGITLR